jgi:hypothetical protein
MACWALYRAVPFCRMKQQSLYEKNLLLIGNSSKIFSLYELQSLLVMQCGANHLGSIFCFALKV